MNLPNIPYPAQPLFLGFHSLEDLCEAYPDVVGQTFYVSPVAHASAAPVGSTHQTVTAQAVLPTGLVVYVRVSVGRCETFYGRPVNDDDSDRLARRVRSALALITGWLRGRGYTVVEGTLATPRSYLYMTGVCRFMALDEQTDTFRPRDREGLS